VQWQYYYFDEPQPLTIETGEVAVFQGAERGTGFQPVVT